MYYETTNVSKNMISDTYTTESSQRQTAVSSDSARWAQTTANGNVRLCVSHQRAPPVSCVPRPGARLPKHTGQGGPSAAARPRRMTGN